MMFIQMVNASFQIIFIYPSYTSRSSGSNKTLVRLIWRPAWSGQKAIAKELINFYKTVSNRPVASIPLDSTIANLDVAQVFLEKGFQPSEVVKSALRNKNIGSEKLISLASQYEATRRK